MDGRKDAQIISGRKNWDVVSFEDYANDTKELAERSGAIIAEQRRQIRDVDLLIGALVRAAGGRIEVYEGDIHRDLNPPELVKEYNAQHMKWIFTSSKPLPPKEME